MDRIFHQIMEMLREVTIRLDVHISSRELPDISTLVYRGMTETTRHFHTPEHIFRLANPDDTIQSLAAIFHDLVNFQVDEGFTGEIFTMIRPYLVEKAASFYLNEAASQEPMYLILLEAFDYRCGQKLNPYYGMNEFLSALVMNTCLSGIVPQVVLLKATLCIEATIPFRGIGYEGKSPLHHLEYRLRDINEKYGFDLTEQEIFHSIERATRFSNHDVKIFFESDASAFLDNTWNLLPEMNASLRFKEIYTVQQYRKALLGMENFLCDLDAKTIFNRYHDVPPLAEYQQRLHYAQTNIEISRQYLGVKLVTIAILEAMCRLSGGDTSIVNFMGPIDSYTKEQRLENHIPAVGEPAKDDQGILYQLLKTGRASESGFDKRDSPLSLYLYQSLGMDEMVNKLRSAKQMFMGELQAIDFLRLFDAAVLNPIIDAGAAMFSDRRDRLLRITERLSA